MCDHKRLRVDELIEGVDFNWEEIDGIRLRCCEAGCRNCPWEYKKTKKTSK